MQALLVPCGIALAAALQVASFVGLSMWTKNLFLEYIFPYAAMLGALAVLVMTLLSIPVRLAGVVEGPAVSIARLWPICASFSASTLLTEISLLMNPISVHAAVCVLAVPLTVSVVLLSDGPARADGEKHPRQGTLMAVLAGVMAAGVLGFMGCQYGVVVVRVVVAVLAVASTCVYWMSMQSLAKELDCSSAWVMVVQLPYSLIIMTLAMLLLDRVPSPEALAFFACAWHTFFMATMSIVVYHIATLVLLTFLSFASVSTLTVPTFAVLSIVAHYKYGERLSTCAKLFGLVIVASAVAFIVTVGRSARAAGLTELMRSRPRGD